MKNKSNANYRVTSRCKKERDYCHNSTHSVPSTGANNVILSDHSTDFKTMLMEKLTLVLAGMAVMAGMGKQPMSIVMVGMAHLIEVDGVQ